MPTPARSILGYLSITLLLALSAALPPSAVRAGLVTNTEEFSGQSHLSPFLCLVRAIYFEARSESRTGQLAVGTVILNRVDHRYHPNTVCEVVYANSHLRNRCQFSFACDGRPERVRERIAYLEAVEVARELMACDIECRDERRRENLLPNSTHYHTIDVKPDWSGKLLRTGRIGRHIFYYTSLL